MIIMPGVNSPSTLDMIELIRTNSNKFVDVTFKDDAENPINIEESVNSSGDPIGALDLEVTNLNGTVLYTESYWPKPIPDTRRITNPSTGKYQIKWGTEDTETSYSGPLLFNWHIRQNDSSEDFYRTQVAEVVTPRTLSLLPRFRLLLDKSIKVVLPEEFCTLGYSDSQLVVYLQAGLARINSAQPYVGWATLDQFPIDLHWEILCRSALLYALSSQYLFAVDTDVPNFSSQGESFVINHASQLKALYDSLSAELERDIREFKLHYVSSGSVKAEFRIGWGFYQMLASSPPGALFKNTYTTMP